MRPPLKDSHPGVWDSSVSGHLDAGEDYETSVVRELEEEMGIVDASPEEIARIPACAATGWEHVRLYRCRHDGPVRFPCAEIEAAQWFSPREVQKWIDARPQDFASGFLECWKAVVELPPEVPQT